MTFIVTKVLLLDEIHLIDEIHQIDDLTRLMKLTWLIKLIILTPFIRWRKLSLTKFIILITFYQSDEKDYSFLMKSPSRTPQHWWHLAQLRFFSLMKLIRLVKFIRLMKLPRLIKLIIFMTFIRWMKISLMICIILMKCYQSDENDFSI